MTPLENVLRLIQDRGLKSKRLRGGQWETQCPAHEDKTPSLSLGEGSDGKLLMNCKAGCPNTEIVKVLNITMADLFPPNGKKTTGDIITATYDYHNLEGELVFQVVRKSGKKFVQRRPDGNGGWIWNVSGVTRVPYHLPDLIATIKEGDAIFIVEGEKDADRLHDLGLTATTTPGGAGKWHDEHRQWFTGAGKVYILPDNDQPGLEHAHQIAQALTPIVETVKVVELPDLPPKGDVSDYLDNGGGLSGLLDLVGRAGEWEPHRPSGEGGTVAELLGETLEPIRWVVDAIIPEGLTFLAGKTKIGKSWLTFLIALAVCSGQDVIGRKTQAGEVLIVTLEDGKRRIQDRIRALDGARLGEHLRRLHYRTKWPTFDRGALDHLEQWMIDHPDTRMIVIDTWGRVRGALPGKDRYSEEYALLGTLQSFATHNRIAVLLVHHLRKEGADDWIEQLSGSQAVTGAADTILGLYRDRGQMDATLRTVSRDAEELELALRFENDSRWVFMGGAAEYRISIERSGVLEALRDLGGTASVADVAELVEKSTANVGKMLVGLYKDKLVYRIRRGVYSLSHPVVPVVSVSNEPPQTTQTTQTTNTHDQEEIFEDNDFDGYDYLEAYEEGE